MVLNSENVKFLEDIYQKFLKGNGDISSEWVQYFKSLENIEFSSSPHSGFAPAMIPSANANGSVPYANKDIGVQSLTESYRRFGNLSANLDPLGVQKRNRELLDLKIYGLSEADLDHTFPSPLSGLKKAKLRDIIKKLEECYCSSIGIEYAYIRNTEERNWLEERIESSNHSTSLDKTTRCRLYEKLVQSETFEEFLAKKYIGKKRFSIEGCEAFIPLMDTVVEESGRLGIGCIVMGMAHRGRLNMLVNILKKPASLIFAEFDENYDYRTIDYADVKYHLGYSYDHFTTSGKKVHLSLAFNPSHLEAVNPVVLGSIRARQTKYQDKTRKNFMPLHIHGDAAFMGQGVVSETLNLCNLKGYSVGGTLHVVINNQIGFTTLPPESRSTEYATDIAKGFQIPIFHVNADDPEAVYRVTKLCLEYRQRFSKDIIIDLIGYRRLGHNEADEPAFTQPRMYDKIKKHPKVVQVYRDRLLRYLDVTDKDLQSIEKETLIKLEETFTTSRENKVNMKVDTMKGVWAGFTKENISKKFQKNILKKQLEQVVKSITNVPNDFNIHPKLSKLLENRKNMYKGKLGIDWGFAEALALGSILESKHNIRLSGQDVKRGTFSHRHCSLIDIKNEREYYPLNNISKDQGRFEAYNSPLSEFAVLGFEYGYTLADPASLVIWEAQFGDFANGAQIIFDQFISSSETKWHRLSGLVVLLPHGYEGQGPEHSSGRLERFLQLCANENMQVCNCSTPAQYFHLLRRQILCDFRKPLIVMSPKKLLRLPAANSTLADLLSNYFQEAMPDIDGPDPKKVKRLLFCSGKIYYDLHERRQREKKEDIGIMRIEQLYPFPTKQIEKILKNYSNAKEFYWVQESPINQGSWFYIEKHLQNVITKKHNIVCIARLESPSPAAGIFKVHQKETEELMFKAIG